MQINKEIYFKIGQTLEQIQLWENEFKLLTIKCNIDKSDDKRSLSNMNNYLLKNKYISINDYELIKKVIEIRNIIIHRFFLEDQYLNEALIEETLILVKRSRDLIKIL